jgi:hypothetical protein
MDERRIVRPNRRHVDNHNDHDVFPAKLGLNQLPMAVMLILMMFVMMCILVYPPTLSVILMMIIIINYYYRSFYENCKPC